MYSSKKTLSFKELRRIRRIEQAQIFFKSFFKNKAAVVGSLIVILFFVIALIAPLIAPYDPFDITLEGKFASPSGTNWMGTDDKGRDVLSRVLYGSRLSLGIGVAGVGMGLFLGVAMGLVAGYYGGWIDSVISRLLDVLLAFPGILLALAIVSALGPSLINVTIAIGTFSIPLFARIARGSTMEIRSLEYIDAARSLGVSNFSIIFVHILPNILSPLVIQGTLRLATAILAAAGLSFLGLGAQPPSPEWGTMLSSGRDYLYTAPHIAIFPGLAIALLIMGFNLFGDGLRDALDPRMKS